ncbi:uncharacterized protein LOC113871490 [Abrus precatorius]|uniref:Uncharacterized protein LOC113871490 n=1 Tax=Abrus precatorius TaxID=3816 RepID=A0A8B8M9C6_ABRPR|nr:uncharacterized protein LOC113871490 [Abrus precatorius]
MPKAYGKVFAMSGKEVFHSDMMIGGTCIIRDTPLSIVFNSGASYSFISSSCVERLRLPTIALSFDFSVYTPGLEVILGLDWLSDNHVIIDCCRKTVVFKDFEHDNSEQSRIQGANYEDVSLKEEVQGFVMSLLAEGKEEKLDDFPVVREFLDDIPGLPLERELEFSIDLPILPPIPPPAKEEEMNIDILEDYDHLNTNESSNSKMDSDERNSSPESEDIDSE